MDARAISYVLPSSQFRARMKYRNPNTGEEQLKQVVLPGMTGEFDIPEGMELVITKEPITDPVDWDR